MELVNNRCEECDGPVFVINPETNPVMYRAFGDMLWEHRYGCSKYPETKQVSLDEL